MHTQTQSQKKVTKKYIYTFSVSCTNASTHKDTEMLASEQIRTKGVLRIAKN